MQPASGTLEGVAAGVGAKGDVRLRLLFSGVADGRLGEWERRRR